MVWGRESPQSIIGLFGHRETFGMMGFRQQAQQSTYPFYSQTFSYSEFSSLATNDVKKNGQMANTLRSNAASVVQSYANSFLIQAWMLNDKKDEKKEDEDEPKEEKEEETQGPDPKDMFAVQCGCIGLSSAIAAAVSHPLAVVGTWQAVQDIPIESRMGLAINRISASCKAIVEASDAIKESKKSYYDGLAATVAYSVCFEVTKFGISKKLHQRWGVEGLTKEIERIEARSNKEGNMSVRAEYNKRCIILRWRRIALNGYLNYVASVGAGLLWYPLETIALRMQAQGASFRFPELFASPGEVVAEQGIVSLFSGAPTLFLSFLSETGFAALTYFFVILALEFMPSEMHGQVGMMFSFMELGQFS